MPKKQPSVKPIPRRMLLRQRLRRRKPKPKPRAQAEIEAKNRAVESEAAEELLRQAEAEVTAALAELKVQEDAFNNKTADLKKK